MTLFYCPTAAHLRISKNIVRHAFLFVINRRHLASMSHAGVHLDYLSFGKRVQYFKFVAKQEVDLSEVNSLGLIRLGH